MDGLQGKVIIVTGGAGGIGLETCKVLAERGARVALVDLREAEVDAAVKDLAGTCAASGGELLGLTADVSDFEAVEAMAAKVNAAFGRIDCLISNAGIIGDAPLDKMSPELFDRVLRVNLYGTFYCAKAVIPYMTLQREGCILNASSVVGIYGNYGQTAYTAAKSGIIGMTKTWAKEYGSLGIRCCAVAPGFIQTKMTENLPAKVVEKLEGKIALRRQGTAREVAEVYAYLCSDGARYLSGIVVEVGGGLVP